MVKRGRLEIIYDILKILKNSHNGLKPTPLLRKSNLSSSRFKKYYIEMVEKEFIRENSNLEEKRVVITEKGILFLDKYKAITGFVEEFGL
jgi:predicted transcriptional regulator